MRYRRVGRYGRGLVEGALQLRGSGRAGERTGRGGRSVSPYRGRLRPTRLSGGEWERAPQEGEPMQTDESRRRTGRGGDKGTADLRALRALWRRQAWAIKRITRVSRDVRTGLRALKVENAELRPASGLERASVDACAQRGSEDWLEMRLPLDVRAPGAARRLVAQVLGDRVAAPVLERAKLVISELVSNSVCHSGVPAAAGVGVRLRVFEGGVWLAVEDPGRDGVIAQRAGGRAGQGGLGLVIVQAVSECWGSECVDGGGT